jgi:hypothetical protein
MSDTKPTTVKRIPAVTLTRTSMTGVVVTSAMRELPNDGSKQR